jgi:hypothetical protein
VTFNRDVSCKKGGTSNAWHARAMDHTQRMEFLCKKIQRTVDAFLGKERVFPVSKKWTCENYNYSLATPNIVDVSFLSCQADDDSLIFSVSACSDHDVTLDANLDDLSNVFSISSLDCSDLAVVEHSTTRFSIYDDDDDMSSDLSLSFSITPVMPVDVEVMPSQPRRSLRIAAMKPVCYEKFF